MGKTTLEEIVGAYNEETIVRLCYMCGAALVKVAVFRMQTHFFNLC